MKRMDRFVYLESVRVEVVVVDDLLIVRVEVFIGSDFCVVVGGLYFEYDSDYELVYV